MAERREANLTSDGFCGQKHQRPIQADREARGSRGKDATPGQEGRKKQYNDH